MLRIRRVFDDLLAIDAREIAQVQQMLKEQFPGVADEEIASLPQKLKNPLKHQFRYFLYVADDVNGNVRGFALVSLEPNIRFWYLDYVAASLRGTGGGVGGALYTRLREEAAAGGAVGLFFECPPDEPDKVEDQAILKQNIARLRFYERFGVRPLAGNAYDSPIKPGQLDMPYLMYDDLGSGRPLAKHTARKVTRAVLERKYGDICPADYVARVVESFHDDPVRVRDARYDKRAGANTAAPLDPKPGRDSIVLVINDKHDIHHIRERGYVEAPARIAAILSQLEGTGLFRTVSPRDFGERHIRAVHDHGYVDYLKRACESVSAGKSVYPYVFPIRHQARPPKELSVRAGYYCIDTFTPLNKNAFPAAKRGVDCTLTAADELLKGERLAYALVRPPGHHAERRSFGGFCYFGNAAIAAHFLSQHGNVAMLDIDYHHGNSQEDIFYDRSDVLTVSIHGHPRFAYPYFSGFADDIGKGSAEGFNLNIPLPEIVDGERYRATLKQALARILNFAPSFLVVPLGLDTAKGDPTGTWTLSAQDLQENGRLIGRLHLPTLVVQEGGYRTRTLGANARAFFVGLVDGCFASDRAVEAKKPSGKKRSPR